LNNLSAPEFDVPGEAGAVRDAGGEFLACGM
jgi:hypothetical protein